MVDGDDDERCDGVDDPTVPSDSRSLSEYAKVKRDPFCA
jgi:hypothetical protein